MLRIAQISYLLLSVAACTQKEVDSVFEAAKKAQKVIVSCIKPCLQHVATCWQALCTV